MNRTEVDQRLRTVFQTLFGTDPATITSDSSPDDVEGWDSLQHLNLVTTIEEEFGIALADEQVIEMLSFGLIVEIVHGALEARGTA